MKKTILLIDDSPQIHALVKAILSEEPVEVHSALEPSYGMVLAASEIPDLILLDVEMPTINGFDVCAQLKANRETAGCPIIFLTSVSTPADKVRGLGIGANDYVTKPFNPDELRARVNASLRTRQVIKSLEDQSLIDPLTGLGNRRMFDLRLKAESALRLRVGNPLSLILLDLDRFKSLNETFGAPAGDRLLKVVADTLADLCQIEDVACRLGGDKFVVLAPATDSSEALIFADEIRTAISSIQINVDKKSLVNRGSLVLTCSIGVAEAADACTDLILDQADQAMNQAKTSGRNRSSVFQKKLMAA